MATKALNIKIMHKGKRQQGAPLPEEKNGPAYVEGLKNRFKLVFL